MYITNAIALHNTILSVVAFILNDKIMNILFKMKTSVLKLSGCQIKWNISIVNVRNYNRLNLRAYIHILLFTNVTFFITNPI